ncbi:unnamed protein product [Dicrocoelium dendriticum]|nr:unnamed protein product [Dicrocoelium dendriticum]
MSLGSQCFAWHRHIKLLCVWVVQYSVVNSLPSCLFDAFENVIQTTHRRPMFPELLTNLRVISLIIFPM